jgi:hypothetical protein
MKIRALVSESSRTSKRSPRLEHEYALTEQLDRSWTTRPIVITRNWDRAVLVLEDPAERLLIIYLAARSAYFLVCAWPSAFRMWSDTYIGADSSTKTSSQVISP